MFNPFDSADDVALESDLAEDSGVALHAGDGFEGGDLGDYGDYGDDGARGDALDAADDGDHAALAGQGDGFEDAADDFDIDGLDAHAGRQAFADDGFETPQSYDDFSDGDAGDFDGSGDRYDAGGDGIDGGGDMALWNAFEDEVADGLDAADEDEFLGRLLGGLGRAGGAMLRRAGGARGIANAARRVAGGARRFGQIAGQAGRVAARVSPAAGAAARLARLLGAPGLASGLDSVSRGARSASRMARRTSAMAQGFGQAAGGFGNAAAGVGQMAQGGQALLAQLSQLIGGGGNEFDDFDAMADLYEDGVDEALPAMVAMAARAAARGLGFRNLSHLGQAGRRALVRGVGSAARELVRQRDGGAIRRLPRIAHTAGRTAARTSRHPQEAAQRIRRSLPRVARRLPAATAAAGRRGTAPRGRGGARPPRPSSRPAGIGRGHRSTAVIGRRRLQIDGPVTLTITPREPPR